MRFLLWTPGVTGAKGRTAEAHEDLRHESHPVVMWVQKRHLMPSVLFISSCWGAEGHPEHMDEILHAHQCAHASPKEIMACSTSLLLKMSGLGTKLWSKLTENIPMPQCGTKSQLISVTFGPELKEFILRKIWLCFYSVQRRGVVRQGSVCIETEIPLSFTSPNQLGVPKSLQRLSLFFSCPKFCYISKQGR